MRALSRSWVLSALLFLICALCARVHAVTYEFASSNAFPNVTFTNAIAIATPPGETNRIFVAERGGTIVVITNLAAPTRTVFMKVTNLTFLGEGGLLGLAFHPGYSTNGYFFLFSTPTNASNQMQNRLSRFETDPTDPNHGLVESETILISQNDGAGNHNGGDIQFGPDGYLYVPLGDEGGGNDIFFNSQRINKDFFSGILRLDVDKRPENLLPNSHPASSTNYHVPADNPFVGATQFNGTAVNPTSVRTEFWAVGLRNPWRMSFDPETGELYCADVGQEVREEVNLITKGGNYGWNYREGKIARPGSGTPPAGFSSIDPIHEYQHSGLATNVGNSIIGGIVYRGTAIPQLIGAYVFGDFASGNIWTIRHDGANVTEYRRILFYNRIITFGRDPRNGDVLWGILGNSGLRRLVYRPVIDISKPKITITYPPSNGLTNNYDIVATGTASDPQGLEQVLYELNNSAFYFDTIDKTNWSANLQLIPGTNTLRIKAIDVNGNETTMTRTFFHTATEILTAITNGSGTLTPNLDGQSLILTRRYTMKAGPGPHHVFSNWTGDVFSTNASLSFVMQSNMSVTANFIPNPFIPGAGSYNGLFSVTGTTNHHDAGFFSMKVTTNFGYSAKILLDGNTITFSGKFSLDGSTSRTLSRAKLGKPDLTLNLFLDFANFNDQVTGTLTATGWATPATILADRLIWNASQPATALTNRYTLLLTTDDDPITAPKAYGYATLTVDALGKVIFKGAMGDNSSFSLTTYASKDGNCPIYAPFYLQRLVGINPVTLAPVTNGTHRGSLFGWVTLTNATVAGDLNWTKTGWTNTVYPDGFTNRFSLLSSLYTPPAPSTRALNFSQASILFQDGNLPESYTRTLNFSINNTFTLVGTNTNKFTMTFDKKMGLFNGSFTFPGTLSQKTTFKGAVLQNQNWGAGFFLGTNQSGSVLLQEE